MQARSSETSPDPLKSLGPFVLLGYVLTRPPVLAVCRVILWVALLFIRPAVRLMRALQGRQKIKAQSSHLAREAVDSP